MTMWFHNRKGIPLIAQLEMKEEKPSSNLKETTKSDSIRNEERLEDLNGMKCKISNLTFCKIEVEGKWLWVRDK